MSEHKKAFDDIFIRLWNDGVLVRPRDLLVREVENFTYKLPPYVRFQSYACRKFSLSYMKREMLWYLNADRFDTSITKHAKMWIDIVNSDGSINSNYGQYIFARRAPDGESQFSRVIKTLENDRDSRRASIMILNSDHLLSDTKDVPCTYSLNFRIRDQKLNMSVHMRSQDAIYGMGNDAPAFSVIHEMVQCALKKKYPDLVLGDYFHVADSFHVYQRHFGMLEKIIEGDPYEEIDCPKISGPDEVDFMINELNDCKNVPVEFAFSRWLKNT